MTATIERPTAAAAAETPDFACVVSQPALKEALTTVSRVAISRFHPVLANVRLTAREEGALELACTDLDTGMVQEIPAEASGPGVFTVPAKLLSDFVAGLADESVSLALDRITLRVTSGRARCGIRGVGADDFPAIPATEGAPSFTVRSGELRRAISLTTVAAAGDVMKGLALNRVHLMAAGESLIFEAADGQRVAQIKVTLDEPPPVGLDALLPVGGLESVKRLLEGGDVDVWLRPEPPEQPNLALFRIQGEYGPVTVVLRLSEGLFPKPETIERWLSVPVSASAVVKRQAFDAAVRQATLFSPASASFQAVRLTTSDGALALDASEAERGEGRVEVPAQTEGNLPTVKVSATYLRGPLSDLPGGEVRLVFAAGHPIVRLEDPSLAGYRYGCALLVDEAPPAAVKGDA